jgi:NAD-dependent SIR2 family protein deacetylase
VSVGADDATLAAEPAAASVAAFLAECRSLFVLTGAGCSTGSGIPDYRDHRGGWKRRPPIQWQAFRGSGAARQRYWAGSFVG